MVFSALLSFCGDRRPLRVMTGDVSPFLAPLLGLLPSLSMSASSPLLELELALLDRESDVDDDDDAERDVLTVTSGFIVFLV